MGKIIFKDFNIPNTCDECEWVGHYDTGLWSRNPHCCCELIWLLKKEDYQVDKNCLDKNCPLKKGYIKI